MHVSQRRSFNFASNFKKSIPYSSWDNQSLQILKDVNVSEGTVRRRMEEENLKARNGLKYSSQISVESCCVLRRTADFTNYHYTNCVFSWRLHNGLKRSKFRRPYGVAYRGQLLNWSLKYQQVSPGTCFVLFRLYNNVYSGFILCILCRELSSGGRYSKIAVDSS